ncbi:hypothetical protein KKG31_06615 [Patescibacteria group bacterium]|nr:hypothetical protein [Patescibacteria group bacterium]MBU1758763.1 hypothetical protein [Patescibacteria group bacterium]
MFKDISSGSVWDVFTTPSEYNNLSIGLSSMVIHPADDTALPTDISLGVLILS